MASTLELTNQSTKSKNTLAFIICLLLPIIVGGVSGFITSSEINSWYSTLKKPSFNPPNYLFGPVWTTLYILMGISSFLIWKSPRTELRKKALIVYGIQLFLNFWWSIIFFSFHLLFFSIIEIVIMWIMILYMILLFRKVNTTSAFMNIPYLLWVSFATALTVSIWVLN